jgi:hypothetical protein
MAKLARAMSNSNVQGAFQVSPRGKILRNGPPTAYIHASSSSPPPSPPLYSSTQSLEDLLGKSTLRLINLVVLAIGMVHWGACLFYFSASWENFDTNTWVYRQGLTETGPYGEIEGSSNYAKR